MESGVRQLQASSARLANLLHADLELPPGQGRGRYMRGAIRVAPCAWRDLRRRACGTQRSCLERVLQCDLVPPPRGLTLLQLRMSWLSHMPLRFHANGILTRHPDPIAPAHWRGPRWWRTFQAVAE